ncbi:MAG: pentapeptide repeat-containing protein [Chloroflexi bacterium]|nr:pentapeptide repeat-containing protein [Chloroflexota bacterium]
MLLKPTSFIRILLWTAGVFTLFAVAVIFVWFVPQLNTPDFTTNSQGQVVQLDAVVRSQLENDLRETWAAITVGFVILLGVIAAFWRASATERNVRILQESQITERFTRAIEQLGSANTAICLGGIYALERIAKDSPENDHRQIVEILTAYVRDNARWTEPIGVVERDWKLTNPPTTVIQAILTVLRRRNIAVEESNTSLDFSYTDLRRADISGLSASGANFYEVHFEGANLNDAHLPDAFLKGANLNDAYLVNAMLKEAKLEDSYLLNAMLNDSNLERASLLGAHLKWANLDQANLKGANLFRADLRHADLRGANLEGAYIEKSLLDDAFLTGANLRRVHGLSQELIINAYWDEETKFPEGFEPPPMRQS